MQPYLQAFFCKTILFSVFCTLGLTPQYAEAQGGCTNSYRVWMDCDADGQKGVFEDGLQGVNVTLYDANCVQIQQVTTDAQGLYSFGNLQASKAYYVVFGNGQYAHNVLNVNGKSHNLSPANTGTEATDSDAQLGGASPSCANGKPYISFTTDALGCVDGLLDAGFIRLDFQLNGINVVHETCGGNRNGSIALDLSNVVGGFSTLITGNTRMAGLATYSNLSPGTYNIEVRSDAPTCNSFYTTTVTINAGQTVSAPTVTDDKVCRNEVSSQNGGLKATCLPCTSGSSPTVTWWTSQTGGYKVYTGSNFDPILQNWINTSVVGTASFWAQCECNGCVSPRARANFVIKPRPEPTITGEKFPCPLSIQTYTTPSVTGSTYAWSLTNGGGTIVSTNNNSVTIQWNNTPGTGPFNIHVVETSKDGCSQANDFKASIKSVQLSCAGNISRNMDAQCHFDMTHSSLLGTNYVGSETYTVQLQTAEGVLLEQGVGHVLLDGISDSGSSYQLTGKQFVYTVIEPCGGSKCSGNINFEDVSPPTITCPADITLACSQVAAGQTPLLVVSGSPTVVDCSKTTTTFTDIVRETTNCQQPFTALPSDLAVLKTTNFPTTGDIVTIILRTFSSKDSFNNVSTCQQYIFLRKSNIQNIICPKDVELDCRNFAGDASIAPSVIGAPVLDIDGDFNTTYDRFTAGTGSCKLQVTYADQRVALCPNSFRVVRQWRIYDPCGTDNPQTIADERVKQCTQTILVSDKTAPSVSASFTQYYVENNNLRTRDTTVIFDGYTDFENNTVEGTIQSVWALGNSTSCGGKTRLTFRMKDEGCTRTQVGIKSDVLSATMLAGYPQFDATTGETVAIFEATYAALGDYDITFTATDDCGFARAQKTFRIKIRDNIKPNVVCKQFTTTLTTNKTVRATAESYNNGSADNCGIQKIEVRRLSNCQNSADTLFQPYVDFYCCDGGLDIPVVLRVWDNQGNYNECTVNTHVNNIQLSCIGTINASIDDQCRFNLSHASLLGAHYVGSETFKIQLQTPNGVLLEQGSGSVLLDGVSDNGSSYQLTGKQFIYTVTEPCGGTNCWGYINFEDKTAPIITCPADITLACSQVALGETPLPILSGTPTINDCSKTDTGYLDIVREANCQQPFTSLPGDLASLKTAIFPTTGDIVKIILRTFTVKDINGNSSSCKQYIFVRKGALQNIICPKDFALDCRNYNGDASVAPSVTGIPLLDIDGDLNTTADRYPIGTGSCKMQVTYTDERIALCTNSFKITRVWKINDLCALDNPQTTADERLKFCTQTIIVADKTAPSVSASFTQNYVENGGLITRDTAVNFDGYFDLDNNANVGTIQTVWALGNNNNCGGKTRLTFRMKDEGCTRSQVGIRSDNSKVPMLAGYPQFDATTGETIAVFDAAFSELGDYDVTFTASDNCGFAQAQKTFRIKIRDNIKPNVVCKTHTTTTLTNSGSVRVLAESFNSSSTDNCGLDRIEVRRMSNCQNPEDTLFKSSVDFNCCDAGTTSQVVLRVWDFRGNYNECMVNIRVDDKTGPTCVAPPNTTILCVDYTFRSSLNFGKPEFSDNCHVKDTVYTEIEQIDNCKVGTLLRKWVIADAGGLKDSCQQLITIRGKSDFTVDFPDDIVASCFEAVPSREQAKEAMLSNGVDKDGHIINDGCGVVVVEVTDDTLTATPDACYKILRKITVVDWCKYNPNNSDEATRCYGKPVCGDVHANSNWATQNIPAWQILERPACTNPSERRFRDADGLGGLTQPGSASCFSDGMICYTQVIKVIDDIAPVFTYCPKDTIVKSFVSLGCSDNVKLTVTANDLCAEGQTTNANYLVFKWLIIDSTTSATVKAGYGNTLLEPLDFNRSYYVVWSVEDRCGNRTYCRQKVKVVDTKKPSLICKDINAELMGDGNGGAMMQVWLRDLLPITLADNCTPSSYLLEHLTIEKNATSSGRYPSVSNTSLMFTCEDAEQAVPIRAWTIDEAGNADYCLLRINVQDNMNACANYNLAKITGSVKTENGETIAGVNVTATSGSEVNTVLNNTIGNYTINNLLRGNSYAVRANREDLPLNGVTTFDIALMSKHILGVAPLSTPYKIIAADLNRDGDISAVDLLYTRRMILRLQTAFPNGTTSWRFIDKRYNFDDPTNPLAEDFPEVVNFTLLPRAAQADFIGLKVGDVSGNATLAAATTESSPTTVVRGRHKALVINTDNIAMEAGKEYSVSFKSDDFNAQAYQFTLNHTEGVEIVDIESSELPNMTENNFGQFKTALTTSWNGNFEGKTEGIFTIVLRAKQNAQLSDVLTIGSNLTVAEAYNKDGDAMDVKLVFNGKYTEGAHFALYQNEPNPFTNQTNIAFNLPTESLAKLTVYDATGRILKRIEQKFAKGYNEIPLTKEDVQATGILYYRLDTPTNSATKKMIIL